VGTEGNVRSVMWIGPFLWNRTSTFFLVGDHSPGQSVAIFVPSTGEREPLNSHWAASGLAIDQILAALCSEWPLSF
jgi:hypothetical protein